jgi:hypothetical protein
LLRRAMTSITRTQKAALLYITLLPRGKFMRNNGGLKPLNFLILPYSNILSASDG